MSHAPLSVSRIAARRFLVRAFALDGFQMLGAATADPHAGIALALDQLRYVQEDSINVCGRIHDLILWARVADYSPGALHRFLYESAPRVAWEHYLPNLCILPVADYPYFAHTLAGNRVRASRWGVLTSEEEAAAETLLARLDAEGPQLLRDSGEAGAAHGHTHSGWGTRTRVVSFVADKLFYHGRLGIARRERFLRAFDRIERLLPEAILEHPHPTETEAAAHLLRKQLRARRLFRLRPADKLALGADETIAVRIEGDKRDWFVFADDAEALTRAEAEPVPETLHLLAPLDPLVYDRDRTRFLWDFDYTWEVYTPAAKRRWGYYVLPILLGDRLVGRIEPRVDKKTGAVTVLSTRWEEGFDPTAIQPELDRRLADLARLVQDSHAIAEKTVL